MTMTRGLKTVALIHLAVVLVSAAFGALVFLYLTLGVDSLAHFGGILALVFGVLFSYVFYGAISVLLVLISSPILWVLARLKHRLPAFALAAAVGGGLGWLFGQFVMTGEDDASIASASWASSITGALGALDLEFARWRVLPMEKRQCTQERVPQNGSRVGQHPEHPSDSRVTT
ncbi:MAG: hypothetical protein KatS3mg132_686 [Limisphaera sp.]|nr:MAG: hypothetical protein KatS3mg132_686 [Limisphaera sp.]